jgi:fructose-1,6-bisphosphatase II
MDTNYGMEIVRATEIAALTAARSQGLGDYIEILNTARQAISKTLNRLNIDGDLINDPFQDRSDIVEMPKKIGQGGRP